MNNDTGVYAIVSPSGKRYVGSAASIKSRWMQHKRLLRAGKHHSKPLQRAWDKYGEMNMMFIKTDLCPITDLLAVEQSRIDSLKPAYNIALAAGAPMRGRKASDETRAKLSARMKKEKHPLWGKSHSEKSRSKMSLSRKAWGFSREAIEAAAAANKGSGNHMARSVMCIETGREFSTISEAVKWLSENGNPRAMTTKISGACSGKRRSAYGFTWRYAEDISKTALPTDYRSGINNHKAKPVMCVETGSRFATITEAAQWLAASGYPKASDSSISAVCKGRHKQAYGYIWRYVD